MNFENKDKNPNRTTIFSDVHRDGIGIEVYRDDALILDIFRNDHEKKRLITTYVKNVPLSAMEEAISAFKSEIPWDFQD